MGYFLNVFNSNQTCVSNILHWGENQEILVAVMTAIGPFGALFRVLSSGYLTKYYGKRSLLIYSDVLTIFGSILSYGPNTLLLVLEGLLLGLLLGTFQLFVHSIQVNLHLLLYTLKLDLLGLLVGLLGRL